MTEELVPWKVRERTGIGMHNPGRTSVFTGDPEILEAILEHLQKTHPEWFIDNRK